MMTLQNRGALVSDSLVRLLAARRAGHSLDAAFYTDSAIFQADMDLIFARHWIFIGHDADVAEPGDVMAIRLGHAPLLILRQASGEVRAFHNVCRHRGAQLVPDGKGRAGNLVCRYHSWTYGLDGGLLFADHMGGDFDRSCRGLKPVALRSVAGLLFVCLAADPPDDIEAMAADMEPYLLPHGLRDAKIARQVDLVEHGNWKLTMENNRECYHCAANHPELTVPLFAYGFGFAPASLDPAERGEAARYDALVEALHESWEAAGLPSRRIERLTGRATGFRTERLPLDQAGESHTRDTRSACRVLLGGQTDARLGGLTFWTQPNSWHHVMADHAVTFCVLPLEPGRTLLRTTWLVHKDAVEGVDYDPANLVAVWEATNRQDAGLVEIAQAGIVSPAYEPGPYSPFTEGLVEDFCRWYVERMSAGLQLRSTPAASSQTPAAFAAAAVQEPHGADEGSFTIRFARRDTDVACAGGMTVLAAARAAGVRLPYACGKGVCGTCKSRLLSGSVEMHHAGGILESEIEDGLALLCCARPTSDLVIDR